MLKMYLRNTLYGLLSTILCLFPIFVIAANSTEDSAQDTGLGGVAINLMEPVGLFSDFIFSGCFVIGAAFLFASVIKYVEHKKSPLMVPISSVLFLLIAGIVLVLLPFTSYLTDSGVHYSFFNTT